MTVWREVQEALLQRWDTAWGSTTPYAIGPEKFDPTPEPWCRVLVQSRPSGNGTLGAPGNRKMDRRGVVFILLRQAPDGEPGKISDLAEQARAVFENCRLPGPNDVRFGNVDIGPEGMIEVDRWWGVTVEAPFDYEEMK